MSHALAWLILEFCAKLVAFISVCLAKKKIIYNINKKINKNKQTEKSQTPSGISGMHNWQLNLSSGRLPLFALAHQRKVWHRSGVELKPSRSYEIRVFIHAGNIGSNSGARLLPFSDSPVQMLVSLDKWRRSRQHQLTAPPDCAEAD